MGSVCTRGKGANDKNEAQNEGCATLSPTEHVASASSTAPQEKKGTSGRAAEEDLQQAGSPVSVMKPEFDLQETDSERCREVPEVGLGQAGSAGGAASTATAPGALFMPISPHKQWSSEGNTVTSPTSGTALFSSEMQSPSRSTTSSRNLDAEASESLRLYAQRNRPKKEKRGVDKFKTHTGVNDENDIISPEATKALLEELQSLQFKAGITAKKDEMSEAATTAPDTEGVGAEVASKGSTLDETTIIKYNIFEDIDGDRLKEFDELFNKFKGSSNYEEHKKKSKKNPNKYSTLGGITTDYTTGENGATSTLH
jgi:hypothetical protein